MRHRGVTRVFMVVCLLLNSRPAAANPPPVCEDTRVGSTDGRPAYELRTIELPVENVYSSLAVGINDRGQILGSYYDGTVERGYVYDNHGVTSIPVSDQSVTGIDDRGQIVGCAYLYVDGQFTRVGYPGARFSCALGINNRGQIVGWYLTNDGSTHGFVYERGTYTTLDVPDASTTFLRDVNNRGQILGFYATDAVHWFVYDHGEMCLIDLSAAPGAFLQGFNDRGQIVGTYDWDNGSRGLLYDDGEIMDIVFPGAGYTEAMGINNRGEIVGFYLLPRGDGLGSFVATPTQARP